MALVALVVGGATGGIAGLDRPNEGKLITAAFPPAISRLVPQADALQAKAQPVPARRPAPH